MSSNKISGKGILHPMRHDYSTEQFQTFRQQVRESFWGQAPPHPNRCRHCLRGWPISAFAPEEGATRTAQKSGFLPSPQLQTGANSYAATSLWLLAVALICHPGDGCGLDLEPAHTNENPSSFFA